uniref:NADH-ubiquinone oxidoreductase chain 2 n=1 Tax=Seladonia aeraria TaxID=1310367 RepID=A0A7T9KR82_9HYME|nr:NADH dehydrogenase subunit 2 [Seladonia aeraria]QQS74768.1 NADH dehydrogenase subunit 2 [Seladonia aeraria]
MNIIIYIILLSLTLISFFTPNLFFMWLFLEISSLLFCIYLNINSNKIYSIMYFLISCMTSILIIYYLLNWSNSNTIILLFSLWMKLGLFPLNSWMNFLMKNINYNSLILLLTIMKCIPMFMFLNFIMFNYNILFILTLMTIPPVLLSFNTSSFPLLMNYSSMYNIPLMLIFSYMNLNFMLTYMIIYMLSTLMIILLLKQFNLLFKNSLNLELNYKNKILYNLSMFMYAQLPPFTPFIIKWNLIEFMNFYSYMSIMIMMIIMSSLIMTFNYLNFYNNNFFLSNFKIGHKINFYKKSNSIIMLISYPSLFMFSMFIIYLLMN